ncbi:MAG TPA: hypothetical protein VF816_18485 [Rhodocyclaceae bacterium]
MKNKIVFTCLWLMCGMAAAQYDFDQLQRGGSRKKTEHLVEQAPAARPARQPASSKPVPRPAEPPAAESVSPPDEPKADQLPTAEQRPAPAPTAVEASPVASGGVSASPATSGNVWSDAGFWGAMALVVVVAVLAVIFLLAGAWLLARRRALSAEQSERYWRKQSRLGLILAGLVILGPATIGATLGLEGFSLGSLGGLAIALFGGLLWDVPLSALSPSDAPGMRNRTPRRQWTKLTAFQVVCLALGLVASEGDALDACLTALLGCVIVDAAALVLARWALRGRAWLGLLLLLAAVVPLVPLAFAIDDFLARDDYWNDVALLLGLAAVVVIALAMVGRFLFPSRRAVADDGHEDAAGATPAAPPLASQPATDTGAVMAESADAAPSGSPWRGFTYCGSETRPTRLDGFLRGMLDGDDKLQHVCGGDSEVATGHEMSLKTFLVTLLTRKLWEIISERIKSKTWRISPKQLAVVGVIVIGLAVVMKLGPILKLWLGIIVIAVGSGFAVYELVQWLRGRSSSAPDIYAVSEKYHFLIDGVRRDHAAGNYEFGRALRIPRSAVVGVKRAGLNWEFGVVADIPPADPNFFALPDAVYRIPILGWMARRMNRLTIRLNQAPLKTLQKHVDVPELSSIDFIRRCLKSGDVPDESMQKRVKGLPGRFSPRRIPREGMVLVFLIALGIGAVIKAVDPCAGEHDCKPEAEAEQRSDCQSIATVIGHHTWAEDGLPLLKAGEDASVFYCVEDGYAEDAAVCALNKCFARYGIDPKQGLAEIGGKQRLTDEKSSNVVIKGKCQVWGWSEEGGYAVVALGRPGSRYIVAQSLDARSRDAALKNIGKNGFPVDEARIVMDLHYSGFASKACYQPNRNRH